MKKIQLKLETLRVTSFETIGMERGTGTVLGQERLALQQADYGTASVYRPCLYSQQPSCPMWCS